MRAITSLSFLMLLTGCQTLTPERAPCFDGWTRRASGPSTVLHPTPADREELQKLTPPGQLLVCVHSIPSGALILISRGPGALETTEVSREGDGYRIEAREVIVSKRAE